VPALAVGHRSGDPEIAEQVILHSTSDIHFKRRSSADANAGPGFSKVGRRNLH